tara:strand:+ start:146 stop:322 length:177 start_codon:yes stop_codon:yes gene_type:complete
MDGKSEYVAFRASKISLSKMKAFAKEKNLSVGELLNIAVLSYMKETELLNIELQRKFK